MAGQKTSYRPRRKYRKVKYHISHLVPNTVNNITVETFTDNATLVKTIMDLTFIGINGAAPANGLDMEAVLHIKPRAIQVASVAGLAEAQYLNVPKEELFRERFLVSDGIGSQGQHKQVMLDTSRKINPGDVIEYEDVAGLNNFGKVFGTITLIIMEE